MEVEKDQLGHMNWDSHRQLKQIMEWSTQEPIMKHIMKFGKNKKEVQEINKTKKKYKPKLKLKMVKRMKKMMSECNIL